PAPRPRDPATGREPAAGRGPAPVAVHPGRAGRDDRRLAPVGEPAPRRPCRPGSHPLRGRRAGHPGRDPARARRTAVTEGETARTRAVDALVAVAARLAAADRLAPAAAEPALQAIAETAVALIPSAAASIALHDAASGRLVFRAAAGPQGGGVVGIEIAAHE